MLDRRRNIISAQSSEPELDYEILLEGAMTPDPYMNDGDRTHPFILNNVDDDLEGISEEVTGQAYAFYGWGLDRQIVFLNPFTEITLNFYEFVSYSLYPFIDVDYNWEWSDDFGCHVSLIDSSPSQDILVYAVYGYKLSQDETFEGYMLVVNGERTWYGNLSISATTNITYTFIHHPYANISNIYVCDSSARFSLFTDLNDSQIPSYTAPLWMVEARFPDFKINVNQDASSLNFLSNGDEMSLILNISYNFPYYNYDVDGNYEGYVKLGEYSDVNQLAISIKQEYPDADIQDIENYLVNYFNPVSSDASGFGIDYSIDGLKKYSDDGGFVIFKDYGYYYPNHGIYLTRSWIEYAEVPYAPSYTLVICPSLCQEALGLYDYAQIVDYINLYIEDCDTNNPFIVGTNYLEIIINHLNILS